MNSDELVAATREIGGLPDADPRWTDARVRRKLYDALIKIFTTPLINAREGYLLHRHIQNVTSGQGFYRLPIRAVVDNPERIEIKDNSTTSRYVDLTHAEAREIADYEDSAPGDPEAFHLSAGGVELIPTPNAAYLLRSHYYLRPSRLIAVLSSEGGEPGVITAVDTDARTITVDELPDDEDTGADIVTGRNIDVVRPNGSHDLVLVEATQTLSGLVFTITDDLLDMSRIQVGDVVFASDQSHYPQLPQDFHESLATAAASLIWASKGYRQKAQDLAGIVKGDLQRLEDLIQPRPHGNRKVGRPRHGVVWGRGRRRYRNVRTA